MDNLTLDMAAREAALAAWLEGVPLDTCLGMLWQDAPLVDAALQREALADATNPLVAEQPCAFYAPQPKPPHGSLDQIIADEERWIASDPAIWHHI